MTSVIVRPAKTGDEEKVQAIMNDAKNLKWLGGFTFLQEIVDRVRKQEETGIVTLTVVEREGEVVSCSEISPKGPIIKMGLVAVNPLYRDFEPTPSGEGKRQGYGSSMYALHALRAALEGRHVLVDQIHWLNEVMKNYLPNLGFEGPVVELRQRARNFCSLNFHEYDLPGLGIEPWIARVKRYQDERGYKYILEDSERYKKTFDELYEKTLQVGKEREAAGLIANRERALEFLEELK